MTFVRRNPLVSFFVLAYGLSWAYWIPLALAGVRTAPGPARRMSQVYWAPRLPRSSSRD